MIYPEGAQVPDIVQGKQQKVTLPDGRRVLYDHSQSDWRKGNILAAAKDGTLEAKIEAQSVAGARPAAAAEPEKAPAAAATASQR